MVPKAANDVVLCNTHCVACIISCTDRNADARTGRVIGRKLIAHWTDVRTDIEQHVTKKVSLAEKEVSC